jgi:hypothetical protein
MLWRMENRDLATLNAGLDLILAAPKDEGRIELIVRRPAVDARETVTEATLDPVEGLVGDCWRERGSASMPDGSANPKAQLTLMNARVAALVAGAPDRIPLAGDQFYVDLDITAANTPPGTRLALGSAVIEVSDEPHTGCRKFFDRFGNDAHRFVNSKDDRTLNLRGINAFVVTGGVVRAGDRIVKVPA